MDEFKLAHLPLVVEDSFKGLISEDPYKYEQKISEITPPPTEQVLESDKINKISQRLSMYDSQLDFLNHFYQFSTDFITIARIKKLIMLLVEMKPKNKN